MPVSSAVAAQERCPECNSRRIRRSKRTEEERQLYPHGKFYRCKKCGARFVRPEARIEDLEVDDSGLYEPKKFLSGHRRRGSDHTGLLYAILFAFCLVVVLLIAILSE